MAVVRVQGESSGSEALNSLSQSIESQNSKDPAKTGKNMFTLSTMTRR